MNKGWRIFLAVSAAILGLVLVVYIGLLAWLLLRANPLEHPLAHLPLWPVACSIRGCVGSDAWLTYHQQANMFAVSTGADEVDIAQSLTTALRAHLVAQAFVRAPVTIEDARRYRQTILRLRDDSPLLVEIGYSAEEYDTKVLLPFLLQEALRAQYRVESTDELYHILEKQRGLWVLPRNLVWNSDSAQVTRRY